jgi:hypothetical protein
MIAEIVTGISCASIGSLITIAAGWRKNSADSYKAEFEKYKQLNDSRIKRLEEVCCLKIDCDHREKLEN